MKSNNRSFTMVCGDDMNPTLPPDLLLKSLFYIGFIFFNDEKDTLKDTLFLCQIA